MRLILCLALLVLAPIAPAATKSDSASSQFIDKSIVTYPTSLGHYSLVKASYDPADVPNGVSLDYDVADAPHELQFNIYVYPLGRVDTAKAVTGAMVEMTGEIHTLEQQKIYADLKFDDAVEFDVAVPPSSILKTDEKEDAASPEEPAAKASPGTTKPEDSALADALQSLVPPIKTTGRKRSLTMTVRGTPSQSLAYVFYRNLFLISVRATVPVSTLPPDKFNALVDRAVQDLVPTMDIQNFGDCGTMHISVDEKSTDKDKNAKAGSIQLIHEMARITRENCANKPGPDTASPTGHEQQAIVYPAGFWK